MDSFIAWVGGKKLLRKQIVERFPKEFNKYVEVFGGAGWVLFYREKHSKKEIYNDINKDLVNLFKCIKYHPDALEKELFFIVNSRQIFQEYTSQMKSDGLTDIQKAAKYYYLIRSSYGAKVSSFGGNFKDVTIIKNLGEVQKRLSKVLIENKSYLNLIAAHDKEDTLFYLDPPYHKTEKMYDTGDFVFDGSQHIKLRDTLKDIKGKFVLSYNDDDSIRELYKNFNIESVERANNLALTSGKDKIFRELIIRNY